MRRRPAVRKRSRAFYLAAEASNYAIALRLIGVALNALDIEHGRAIVANASEISKRLDVLKSLLRRNV